jgi:hypothetical protein
MTADSFGAAWTAIGRPLAPITREDERVDAPLTFQIFTATS